MRRCSKFWKYEDKAEIGRRYLNRRSIRLLNETRHRLSLNGKRNRLTSRLKYCNNLNDWEFCLYDFETLSFTPIKLRK